MTYQLHYSKHIKKKAKQWQRDGNNRLLNALKEAIDLLAVGNPAAQFVLREQWKDHQLKGKLSSHRELHLDFDQVLVYQIYEQDKYIDLIAVISHDELKKWKR